MREAQRLMLKHNIEVATTFAHKHYGFRHLGEPTARLQAHQRYIGAILSKFFFVEVLWVWIYRPLQAKLGKVLEVCGTDANIELAEYVHDFLVRSGDRLWREHKQARGLRADTDRRSYLCGAMRGFFEKLEAQQQTDREQGLVWVKDSDLSHYLRRRYPHRRTLRPHTLARNASYGFGKQAGSNLVLHKPVGGGGGRPLRLLAQSTD